MSAQSTDEANSAPLIGATDVTNGLSKISSRSAQAIATDDAASTGGDGVGEVPVAPEAS